VTLLEETGAGLGSTIRPSQVLARFGEENASTKIVLLPTDRFLIEKQELSTDLAGNESVTTIRAEFGDNLPGTISAVALDTKGYFFYAGTNTGHLLRWDLSDASAPQLLDSVKAVASGKAITALNLVLGDISIAVGDATGGLNTWFPVAEPGAGSNKTLTQIHPLGNAESAISKIIPSARSKTLFSLDGRGRIHVDHMTSERRLMTLANKKTDYSCLLFPAEAMALSPWMLISASPAGGSTIPIRRSASRRCSVRSGTRITTNRPTSGSLHRPTMILSRN
jgi:ABC-type uncharacterized transport system permease subunit